jgi:hypothetical protein
VQYRKEEDYSIYTSTKWSCKNDEEDADGKSKVNAQWCWVRETILGRGSGYCMSLGQHITLINNG